MPMGHGRRHVQWPARSGESWPEAEVGTLDPCARSVLGQGGRRVKAIDIHQSTRAAVPQSTQQHHACLTNNTESPAASAGHSRTFNRAHCLEAVVNMSVRRLAASPR